MNGLHAAILAAGGQGALSRKLGGALARVSEWKRRGQVPADMVLKVADAVQWCVTPHQIRPDLYPHPDDGLPPELRGTASQAAE